ncbi:Plasmodium exported protein (Pm-fam-a like), unknown function [Plasmodium malariae]|uniref:Fam-l protein n=1 Tax=Plasmodium malariae TaxID=5858 RepID=A0A1A8WLE2_PLAMA|nr:Plasmodium exported protein (Pm-fam-a like), unknown function [Plasmodium malariae]
MSRFNKILDEKHGSDKKLYKRIYRLLGKCKKSIFANVGYLELNIPYNTKRKNEEIFTVDNEKFQKEKKEKLDRSLLYKEKLIKQLMKNKCTMLHKSYNHYEKKIMNGLNDKNFFKKIMLINDKEYKKLKRKKYGLRLSLLLLLFVVLLIIPILDLSLGGFDNPGYILIALCNLINTSSTDLTNLPRAGDSDALLPSICDQSNMTAKYKASSILIYCLPILIFGIILILGIFYYYKKVIKHKKIKYLKAFNECIFANVGYLELNIPYNTKRKNEEIFTVDNEKFQKEKKEKLDRSLLYKEKLIKQLMKNKCTMLHKSYNHYEKKIMNGLNDKNFFKKIMLINDKEYKKLKRKKYGLRLSLLLLLFVVLLIIPILDLSLGGFDNPGYILIALCNLINTSSTDLTNLPRAGDSDALLPSICDQSNMTAKYKASSILIYCLPILIFGIILILGIFYYYKKVIKHKKIKYLKAFNEW